MIALVGGRVDVGVAADRGAGHCQHRVGSPLRFGAGEVVLGGVVAEALAGVGPVVAPLGLAVPGEDLGELDAEQFGEESGEVPPAVGVGDQLDVTAGLGSLVAISVAVGVGERFPGAQIPLELDERQVDCVVEEHAGITLEHLGVDVRVCGDAGHCLALRDADGS